MTTDGYDDDTDDNDDDYKFPPRQDTGDCSVTRSQCLNCQAGAAEVEARGRSKGWQTTKDCEDATDVDDTTRLAIFLGKGLQAKILMQITVPFTVQKMTKEVPGNSFC